MGVSLLSLWCQTEWGGKVSVTCPLDPREAFIPLMGQDLHNLVLGGGAERACSGLLQEAHILKVSPCSAVWNRGHVYNEHLVFQVE